MDRGPVEKAKFCYFPNFAYFSSKWGIFTFELSFGHLVMIFIILEGFPESRISKILHFSRPVVN